MKKTSSIKLLLFVISLLLPSLVQGERIKDLASIEGVRDNQLVGYGLVVGLNGTGDQTSQTPFTVQSLRSMLAQFGITMPASDDPRLKNVAAVSVHADLHAFAKIGQRIDVTVSSIGNAKSLRGGSLLMTPLKGADSKVYAVAQGNLVVGGFGVSSKDGSSITVNVPSAGRIPNGATVERIVATPFNLGNHLTLNLHSPDFTTVARVSEAINLSFGIDTARAIDGASIKVNVPPVADARVAFVSALENITLEPGLAAARVVINSRTGTVVIGSHVRLSPAAVSHGSLTVSIKESPRVSQPAPFAAGNTTVVTESDIEVNETGSRMFLLDPGVSLSELVRAVNQVGAAPGDLVAILEALKQAGALHAQLIVI